MATAVEVQKKSYKALTAQQERRLVEYVEEKLLDITRNFKKRSEPSSTLQTLSSYLKETHALMVMILQIPPVAPSVSLRTMLFLRFTGETLNAIVGYHPNDQVLYQLLEWLNHLDEGWRAILNSQVWDPEIHSGVATDNLPLGIPSMTQTEKTRLRSLLQTGSTSLEDWISSHMDAEGRDFTTVLDGFGLQQGFDDLFAASLSEMGSFDGFVNAHDVAQGSS